VHIKNQKAKRFFSKKKRSFFFERDLTFFYFVKKFIFELLQVKKLCFLFKEPTVLWFKKQSFFVLSKKTKKRFFLITVGSLKKTTFFLKELRVTKSGVL
jgi:hypothetical protein